MIAVISCDGIFVEYSTEIFPTLTSLVYGTLIATTALDNHKVVTRTIDNYVIFHFRHLVG